MRGHLNASMTLAVAVCLIAGVLVVVAPPAGAAAGWSAVPSPRFPGYGQVFLYGVSCPSTTNCFAVGWENSSSGPSINTALVEHWNGHTWSIMTSPKPTGSPGDANLSGVSCPSTTSCFAVGSTQSGHAPNAFSTLVEHWNGHTWSIMTSPNPRGSGTPNSYLDGVSCRSTTSCFAVGFSIFHGWTTLVEHWNGHTWSIMTSPNPTGFQYHRLRGVSCPSTTSCYAVGFSQLVGNSGLMSVKALVEHWNGHTWSGMTRPTPTGTDDWNLSAVSCSSPTSCFTVGSDWVGGAAYTVGAVERSLAEHWDGQTWSIITSPNPTSATSTTLGGVSCPTPTHCFAVGAFSHDTSLGLLGVRTVEKTLVEQWNGHTWSIMTSPDPTEPGGFASLVLNGVSCHRPTSCFAVGEYASQNADGRTTLIERYR